MTNEHYRVFIRGQLRQDSGLSVGGTQAEPGNVDQAVALDGNRQPTLFGTALSGAFIETLVRIEPELAGESDLTTEFTLKDFRDSKKQKQNLLKRISGKQVKPPVSETVTLQSALQFYSTHIAVDHPREIRQGVGLRQATGATAIERQALYDYESLPAGTTWEFLLEIDTTRLHPDNVNLVLRGIQEWAQGRCWLGASNARGTGWLTLKDVQVLKLPLSVDSVRAWPSNQHKNFDEIWAALKTVPNSDVNSGVAGLSLAAQGEANDSDDRWHYLTLDIDLDMGKRPTTNGVVYGLDALSVGGHATAIDDLQANESLIAPLGISANQETFDDFVNDLDPNLPFVATARIKPTQDGNYSDAQDEDSEPFIPGSGLRGPMRHAASRWFRDSITLIPDPNSVEGFKIQSDENRQANDLDRVSALFGETQFSSRLLVRDAQLKRIDHSTYRMAVLQQHAADEFASGPFETAKFNRTVMLEGTMTFRIVFESKNKAELLKDFETLRPVLAAATLGHVPVGRAKWNGLGWVAWKIRNIELARAGEHQESSRSIYGIGIDRLLNADDAVESVLFGPSDVERQEG